MFYQHFLVSFFFLKCILWEYITQFTKANVAYFLFLLFIVKNVSASPWFRWYENGNIRKYQTIMAHNKLRVMFNSISQYCNAPFISFNITITTCLCTVKYVSECLIQIALTEMVWSRLINKPSLISSLNLFAPVARISKWSKCIQQRQ